jgi:hypothetical protein
MRILHHGLGLWPTVYKDVARMFVHHTRAPLDVVIPTAPHVGKAIDRQTILAGRAPPSRRASPPPSAAEALTAAR